MFDLSKIEYRVVAITPDGEQLDITDATHGLGWSEGEKELSAVITLKLAGVDYNGKNLSEVVTLMTPLIIYGGLDGSFYEVIRGTVQKCTLRETNGEQYIEITAYDEVYALRRNQASYFFTDGHTSTAILDKILTEWGVPHQLEINEVTHAKKKYDRQYLIDMIEDVLQDIKEKSGDVYFVQARQGTVFILPRGTNETTLHFDVDYNLTRTEESLDISGIVTRVLVVAKSKEEGHQKIEQTVDGKIDLGVRQVIYVRGDKTTLEEAEKAAKKILSEQGEVKHDVTVEGTDMPSIRKGDRIRVRSTSGQGYFFIKSIRHNAASQKMTLTLDEDKAMNSAYETAHQDESSSSAPP